MTTDALEKVVREATVGLGTTRAGGWEWKPILDDVARRVAQAVAKRDVEIAVSKDIQVDVNGQSVIARDISKEWGLTEKEKGHG